MREQKAETVRKNRQKKKPLLELSVTGLPYYFTLFEGKSPVNYIRALYLLETSVLLTSRGSHDIFHD